MSTGQASGQAGTRAAPVQRPTMVSAQVAAAGSSSPEPVAVASAAPSSAPSYSWTILRGKPVGDGTHSVRELRKPLKIQVSGEPDYEITGAYAARSSLTSVGTDVIVEITNRGDKLHCFVTANPLVYKDDQGASIKVISTQAFVSGAIGVSGPEKHTNTCLGPEETGYFLDIALMSKEVPSLFDKVAEVDLTLMHQDFGYERPKFRFSAIGYSVEKQTLSVQLRNEGPDAVPVDQSAKLRYLLMDAQDQPLIWGFLDVQNKQAAAAGETITASTDAVYYDGSAAYLQVAVSPSAN